MNDEGGLNSISFVGRVIGGLGDDGVLDGKRDAFLRVIACSNRGPFMLPSGLGHVRFGNSCPSGVYSCVAVTGCASRKLNVLLHCLGDQPSCGSVVVILVNSRRNLTTSHGPVYTSPTTGNVIDSGRFAPFVIIGTPMKNVCGGIVKRISRCPAVLGLVRLSDCA